MASSRKLTVEFIGDTSSLEKAFGRSREATDKASGRLNKLQGPAKAASIALGVGLVGAAKAGFDELAQGQKVSAQTEAVLKSTGGQAGITAKQVGDLASSISAKSGMDDQAIQSGENLLLTFTNVRDEAGKGNDVFSQATSVMADMSTALGQDTKSSALQLGKALNDPIKGVTALQRVGVSFTEDQKKQIKAMVASGDTMGAQKLILAELNKEFGGSAEAAGKTFPGQLSKLKNSFEDVAAGLVGSMLPAMQAIAGVFATIGGFLQTHPALAQALGVAVAGLAVALGAVAAGAKIAQAATALWSAAVKIATAVQFAWNAVMSANPIALVILALVALGAAFVIAWRKSETFRDTVIGTWEAIKAAAVAVWESIGPIIVGALKWAWERVRAGVNAVATWLREHWTQIRAVAKAAWEVFKAVIVTPVREAFENVIKPLVVGVASFLAEHWDEIKAIAKAAWTAFKTLIVNPVTTAVSTVKDLIGGVIDWLRTHKDNIQRVAEGLAKPFVTAFNTMKDAVQAVLDVMDKIIGVVRDIIDLIKKIKIPDIDIPFIGSPRPGIEKTIANTPTGGTFATASRVARMFGLTITSGYRTPQHNAAVGGVPNSMHTHGTPGNPGAIDLVGPPNAMYAAAAWARAAGLAREILVHDAGSGLHLHLGFFKKGGVSPGGLALVGEAGRELVHLPGGSRVFNNADTERLLRNEPLVYIENLNVREEADIFTLSSRLAFLVAS